MARRLTIAGLPIWTIALVAGVAGAAWVAGGMVAARRIAAQLPVPDVTAASDAVRRRIVDADAAARRSPSAATVGALAEAYHGSQRPIEAMAAYAVAAALAPDEPRWTYQRALLLEERGDAEAARTALEQVVATATPPGLAWFRLAELSFKRGRLDDAAAAYTRARDAAPEAPFVPVAGVVRQVTPLAAYARLGLARVALEQGRADAAAQELRAVVDTYPTFGAARGLLREAARGSGTPAPATGRAFESSYVPPADWRVDAIVAASVDTDLLLKHAGLATRAGDPGWREFLVRRALAANPRDLNVLMAAASMLQAQGRPAEALEYLRQHEALAPGDHHGLVEQGRSLIDLNRLDEAEAVLRRAVMVRDAAAEYNLASALDRQDRWDEARAHYEQALAIDPFHARAMNNLGIGLDRRGDSARALALFERAIAVSPSSGEFYVNYGVALLGRGRFDDAVRALDEAVALTPRDANAHNNLGIARARRGDLAGARTAFRRALDLDPRHPDARANLAAVSR